MSLQFTLCKELAKGVLFTRNMFMRVELPPFTLRLEVGVFDALLVKRKYSPTKV